VRRAFPEGDERRDLLVERDDPDDGTRFPGGEAGGLDAQLAAGLARGDLGGEQRLDEALVAVRITTLRSAVPLTAKNPSAPE